MTIAESLASPPFEVRVAQPADRNIIAEYNQRLAEETEDKRLDSATISAGVAAVLDDPTKGRYLVAHLADGQVIGQLMHTREWSDWRNGEIWWLQSVYVHQEHRRRGVFRRLLSELESMAKSATPQVIGMRLYVEQENASAQNTYNARGFANPGYFVMENWFEQIS